MNTYLPLWTQSPYINQSRNKHVFNIFVFFRIFYPFLTICSHIQPTFFQLLVSNIFPHENSHQMSIHHPHHVHDPRSTARCSVPPSARGRGAGSEEEGTEGGGPQTHGGIPWWQGTVHIWLVVYQPLWQMMEFVSWDYYSQDMEQ